MTQFYSDVTREDEEHALPNCEVFYMGSDVEQFDEFGHGYEPGWYWQACFPGCLPDSEPNGPFKSEAEAIEAARDEEFN